MALICRLRYPPLVNAAYGFFPLAQIGYSTVLISTYSTTKSKRIPASKRIGPHNIDVLSILIGSLLGDGSLERKGDGTRFCFYQEKSHAEYLLWLHSRLFELGYCKEEIPKIMSRSGEKGLRYYLRFRTFTFSSLNWIYEGFYKNSKKVLPEFIEYYLNPEGLAI